MSSVVGIDLSSKALDLVKLDETSNEAEWERVQLDGDDAWERTLRIPVSMPSNAWWDDVYLVAVEAPYGRGQSRTLAVLNRVVGAVVVSLPSALTRPERCWLVAPHEWKNGLGLTAKPTADDLERIAPGMTLGGLKSTLWAVGIQDRWDAACIALWARQENAKGIAA